MVLALASDFVDDRMIPGLWTSKLGQEYDIQQVPFSLFLLKRRCTGRFMTGGVG